MPDLEKVIQGLSACAEEDGCDRCPYEYIGCRATLAEDAIALLKEQEELQAELDIVNEMNTALYGALEEQEARVMQYDEIKKSLGSPVWVEYSEDESRNGFGVPTSDCASWIEIYGANAYSCHSNDSHGIKWRAWTARPTDEQRKAVPWEVKEGKDEE